MAQHAQQKASYGPFSPEAFRRFRAGDSRVGDSLWNALVRMARRMMERAPETGPEDVVDVVAESIARALLALNKGTQVEDFRGWMTRILLTSYLDTLRQRKREPCTTSLETLTEQPLAETHARAEGRLLHEIRLQEFFRQRSQEDNALFACLFTSGLTQAETALRLGYSRKTINKRWQRLRDDLIEFLNDNEE